MKKIGIFSGTFDPIHEGHLSFAREALQRCNLDKIFFLVEPRPRRKQGVKAFEHRIAMVTRAIHGEPLFGSIVLEQARFTPHETMPLLQARFRGAQIYMLIGEDMLNHLANWPHVEELVDGVTFIIGLRHKSVDDIEHLINILDQTRGLRFKYQIFQAKNSIVSSSSARAVLRKGREPVGINPSVLRYIKNHNLYSISGE